MTHPLLRASLVWLLMMVAESVHGVLRQLFLAPYLGGFRSRQIGVLSGAAIILALAYLFIDWVGGKSRAGLWGIGLFWAVCTLVFEITLGRLAFGYSWQRILEDYDVRHGGWMPAGILWMAFCPIIAAGLRSWRLKTSHSKSG